MRILIVGASRGLGRAFVEGLCEPGDTVIGVSRSRPQQLQAPSGVELQWIEADLASPQTAVEQIEQQAPDTLDVILYNVGVWEDRAFSDEYAFLEDDEAALADLININVTATLLLLKRLLPRLLQSARPQVVLTGSTSGLRQSGQPEVAFGASKFALSGIADALREGFREQKLAVTTLQLGYLNTDDGLNTPLSQAVATSQGEQIPVHDVVAMVRALLKLSDASFVRELVMPAILDQNF
ncbi:SDR family NAD(P)-dependent oxidoreductase [Natronospirillum operosum]|uniref:SDR family NAD(P)-dependent oxidoreductase n=1 Tax=Natronospirillum operosum TaxID=2759953 RepID=A0A4Z0WBH6_9GAMM|nr:SDR family NAD(P)-dependent oxidoreductase [Natronospirillum operosum]TGG90629.1 SDR family NAD(P)-dependent oxidoreductase [Natronospirillum operosum]